MKVYHNKIVEIESDYHVGNLVKFRYDIGKSYELEERISYSVITKIVPKFEDHQVKLHYLMENKKFVSHENILNLERK